MAAGLTLEGSARGGEEETTRPLSILDCFQLALEHNLNLRVERINTDIARHTLSLAYAGYDPQLTLSGRHNYSTAEGGVDQNNIPIPGAETDRDTFNVDLGGTLPTGLTYGLGGGATDTEGTRAGFPFVDTSGAASIDLRQPLLKNFWIDSTRLNIRVGKIDLKTSEEGLRLTIMSLVTQVETAYYDLLLAIENVKVQEKALELAERLYQENRKRVEVGSMAPLEEKQAEAEVASSRASLLDVRLTLDTRQDALKALITDDYLDWHKVTIEPTDTLSAVPPVVDVQDSWQKGMTMRPDLIQSRLSLERAGYQLKYDYNQLFPQLDLVGSYGRAGNDVNYNGVFSDIRDETSPFYSYGAVLTIPLGNKAARERHKISKAQHEQALLNLKIKEQDILNGIDIDVKTVRTTYERVDATKQARLYREAALEAEQKKLENGKSTSFAVLQFQRDLTAARSAEVEALASYNRALANLALDEGSTLEKHEITVDLK